MSKREVENKIEELLSVLMVGTRQQFKEAKKEIEKLRHDNHKGFHQSGPIVLKYISKFDEIEKPENQAAFCAGLSLFFLALGDSDFDELKSFTLKTLQHPHGTVREAIRKTAEWLFSSLGVKALPFIYPKGRALTNKEKAAKIVATMQYRKFVQELEELMDRYEPDSEISESIEEMKPSIYKSLQLYWSRLTAGSLYREMLEQSHPVPRQILLKRREIEQNLIRLLDKTRREFGLDLIKSIIFNEQGHDDLTDLIGMFDPGIDGSRLQSILDVLSDAWNFFPHRGLDGLSPEEFVLQHYPRRDKPSGLDR